MLVLSRGRNDKIVFPNLGITVEILNIASNKVRVGVDAPPSVTVLRHELAGAAGPGVQPESLNSPHKLSHEIRNRLHAANLALHLSQKLLQANRQADAERTLQKALDEFAAVEQQLTRGDQPAPAATSARTRGHALIVEDNLNESELLASYLRLSGFQVDTARDGCDALSLLEAELRPDAILLDMRMPRCDGPTTVNAIRSNPDFRDLKVYAISGTSPDMLGVERGPRGVDRWFPKPLNPEVLVRELSHQLNVTSA
jgi:carbon storage regulator CsrA